MHLRHLAAIGGVALASALAVAPASATDLPSRTVLLSNAPDGSPANGASGAPALSSSGGVVAFDSTASNLGPADPNLDQRDVYSLDLTTGARRLVSMDPLGLGGNGPSYQPVLSGSGSRVAFTSAASNLVGDDTNGVPDIFVRDADLPVVRVSVGNGGQQADGASYDPSISDDGRFVAFVSDATNLVPDDTNGQADVFVRDLRDNTTTRVSVASDGTQASGRSMAPAISANGNAVAFTSGAANLVKDDTNGVMDVFVRDLAKGTTERVSIATSGRQQNRSVTPPFVQQPSISDDGRFVAFDSDATSLYKQDINKHTDIFLRDRSKKTTTLVSASSADVEGDNDSFAPRLTKSGRFLTFESFATNLAPRDGPREDIFLRDLKRGTTTVLNVTATGLPRGEEQVAQLLQRPSISQDAKFAVFTSTVTNLVPHDTNKLSDIFARLLTPATGRIVQKPKPDHAGTVKIQADDPQANANVCQIDTARPFICGNSIPIRRSIGRRLSIRVGGPGLLYAGKPLRVKLSNDHTGPKVSISPFSSGGVRTIRGRAIDRNGISRVVLLVAFARGGKCQYVTRRHRLSKPKTIAQCRAAPVLRATGGRHWTLRLPYKVHASSLLVFARAYDKIGNLGKTASRFDPLG